MSLDPAGVRASLTHPSALTSIHTLHQHALALQQRKSDIHTYIYTHT
jgi:hypothetical protein